MTSLLVESPRPQVVREHRWAPWFAVATVCFGAFMGQLDASIVTLAFPALQTEFGVRLAAAQWVSLGYLLVLVALLVPVGRWSDRAGRKLIYLYGFVVFTAASAACGFATSMPMLVGLRLVQAVGAAMLQANSVALVATSVPGAAAAGGAGCPGRRPGDRPRAGADDRWAAGRLGRLAVDLLDQRPGRCPRRDRGLVPAAPDPPARRPQPPRRRWAGAAGGGEYGAAVGVVVGGGPADQPAGRSPGWWSSRWRRWRVWSGGNGGRRSRCWTRRCCPRRGSAPVWPVRCWPIWCCSDRSCCSRRSPPAGRRCSRPG